MAISVAGGFWEQYGSTLTLIGVTSWKKRRAAMAFDKMRDNRELAITLDGAAAGAAALDQTKRIEANVELGGVRTIETVDNVNRVTVAGDVTMLNTYIYDFGGLDSAVAVANLDGNPLGTR